MIIWLASYPRSGNTALRMLLKQVFGVRTHSLYDDKGDIGARPNLREAVGHVDHGVSSDTFYALASKSDETFFVKTHDSPSDDAKAIYIVRDGRSAVVSYLHYLYDFSAKTSSTMMDVILGHCEFLSWSEHFDAWAPLTRKNTLLLRYADIINNSDAAIDSIAAFTGLQRREAILPSFSEVKQVDPHFFRSGSDRINIGELKDDELDTFWLMHGRLMVELGYVDAVPSIRDLTGAARRIRDYRPSAERGIGGQLAQAKHSLMVSESQRIVELAAIEASRTEVKAHQDEISQLQSKLKTLESERIASAETIQERETETATLRGEVLRVVASLAKTEEERDATLVQIADLEKQLEVLRAEVGFARASLTSSEADRSSRLREISELEAQIQALETERGQMRSKIEDFNSDQAARLVAAQEQEAQIAMLNTEVKRLTELLSEHWSVKIRKALRILRSKLSRGNTSLMGNHASPTEPIAGITDGAIKIDISQPGSPEIAAFYAASTARALERIAARSLQVSTVIDVGASNGMWSAVTRKTYPDATYFLIEAQAVHEPDLLKYCEVTPDTSYVLAAAGEHVGQIYFDDSAPFGGVASNVRTEGARTILPVTTIDHEVRERGLRGPFLVKLDTHGFEVPILKGASETLKQSNLVVIEVYNFRIAEGSLLFDEMCAFMRGLGFRTIDISEPLWRQRDGAFWQMDLFFVPLDRPEFSIQTYA